ncbi:MAG: magnesium transporter [Campylobacter sp.]|nr:magnesium transporter [Campylobacter sp.]
MNDLEKLEESKDERAQKVIIEAIEALNAHIDGSGEHLSGADIANSLKIFKKYNETLYKKYLHAVDIDDLADAAFEMPNHMLKDILETIPKNKIIKMIEKLESDDQVELLDDFYSIDENFTRQIFHELDDDDKEDILKISSYKENEAGSYMQVEFFSAKLDETVMEAVDRLRDMRHSGELGVAYQLFAVDDDGVLKYAINLSDLILYNFSLTIEEVVRSAIKDANFQPITVLDKDTISDVAKVFGDYDLSVVPVVDNKGVLLGRITPDDIHDFMTESATEQIYNLAGVDDEAEEESASISKAGRSRAIWLGLNLITAFLASFVIGLFDATIESYVALAVLMPVVTSLGGNVGMQSLTVTVRRLALGDINFAHAREVIKKECSIAIINGVLFAILVGIVATLWFKGVMVGVIIILAMFINLSLAGFFGAIIPLMLKKFGVDPAVGSSVILTGLTDIIGFLVFLGLATIILL